MEEEGSRELFSSPQCTGYNFEYKLTEDLCWPTKKAIAKKTRDMVKQYKANSVFIATDNDPYTSVIEQELKTLKKPVSSTFLPIRGGSTGDWGTRIASLFRVLLESESIHR